MVSVRHCYTESKESLEGNRERRKGRDVMGKNLHTQGVLGEAS